MSEFAIRVENLSKQYRIGAPSTLRRGSGQAGLRRRPEFIEGTGQRAHQPGMDEVRTVARRSSEAGSTSSRTVWSELESGRLTLGMALNDVIASPSIPQGKLCEAISDERQKDCFAFFGRSQ